MMKRFALMLTILIAAAAPASANPGPMMSDYLVCVAMPAYLIWCVLGAALIAANRKLRLISLATFVLAIAPFFLGLYEFVVVFWQIFLALLVAHYACQRRGRRDPDWLLNLTFHGSFLLIMIVAGVWNKFDYWGDRWGGFRYQMQESFAGFFILFLICGVIVFVFSHAREWGLRATAALNKNKAAADETAKEPGS